MNIYEKLAAVQQELKAPKDKKNTYGGYSYRSAEGILEAVKPVLKKYDASLILFDNIEAIGGRIYVKATAQFVDPKGGLNHDGTQVSVTAYAREAEAKKGMDESQITGTASSYARKYALNGLLLIDDTKDADTDEYHRQTQETPKKEKAVAVPKAETPEDDGAKISPRKASLIGELAEQAKVDLKTVLLKPVTELTNKQADALIASLRKKIGG